MSALMRQDLGIFNGVHCSAVHRVASLANGQHVGLPLVSPFRVLVLLHCALSSVAVKRCQWLWAAPRLKSSSSTCFNFCLCPRRMSFLLASSRVVLSAFSAGLFCSTTISTAMFIFDRWSSFHSPWLHARGNAQFEKFDCALFLNGSQKLREREHTLERMSEKTVAASLSYSKYCSEAAFYQAKGHSVLAQVRCCSCSTTMFRCQWTIYDPF